MYKIWQKVKTSHYYFTIHSIVNKDWKVFYDGVDEKDIIWLILKNDRQKNRNSNS